MEILLCKRKEGKFQPVTGMVQVKRRRSCKNGKHVGKKDRQMHFKQKDDRGSVDWCVQHEFSNSQVNANFNCFVFP